MESIRSLLEALYGPSAAVTLHPRLRALVDRWKPLLPASAWDPLSSRHHFGQQDLLLIAYPDHLRQPGVAPLQTLAEFALTHLRGLVSGIHLLPFYPWSSDDGFAVKDYFSVDPAYGDWAAVTRLSQDFDLMFDAVFNHMSAQGDWFHRFLAGDPLFRDFFVTVDGAPSLKEVVRPRALPLLTEFQTASGPRRVWTTFSADQVDLNLKNPEVLLKLVEALLFYVGKGARFIRLDAIAFLWKEIGTRCLHLPQTHSVIQLFRAVLDEAAPSVHLVTETNVPHAENLSYFGDGTNEAQMVYNFALPPLVLHSFISGSSEELTSWARSLSLPSPRVTFFNFLASHDGIGLNPARGILTDKQIEALAARALRNGGFISYKSMADGSEVPYELNINYLDALATPGTLEDAALLARKFLTSQAIMLSLQGVPGVYLPSLIGSRGDRKGAETTGIKRRINREKLELASVESELADPTSLRARVFSGYRALLRKRRTAPALAPDAPQTILNLDPRVFALLREAGGLRLLCVHNVSAEPVTVSGPIQRQVIPPLAPFDHIWLEL